MPVDDAALLLAGAIAGAVATGLTQLLIAWRQRQLDRMVAARLILSGLLIVHHEIELIEKQRRWPDRPDFETPLRDWLEARERFIAAVTAAEWVLTDRLFQNLRLTATMVRTGEPCNDNELAVLTDLKRDLPRVTEIVGEHATPKRQQAELINEVITRPPPQGRARADHRRDEVLRDRVLQERAAGPPPSATRPGGAATDAWRAPRAGRPRSAARRVAGGGSCRLLPSRPASLGEHFPVSVARPAQLRCLAAARPGSPLACDPRRAAPAAHLLGENLQNLAVGVMSVHVAVRANDRSPARDADVAMVDRVGGLAAAAATHGPGRRGGALDYPVGLLAVTSATLT